MLQLVQTTIKFGGLVAVNQVSAEFKRGGIYGLIGPNGAGKTTLFNIISGVYAPTSGKVIFENKEIQGLPPYKINGLGIARTYQNINLFKRMTLLENTLVGCHSRTKSGSIAAILRTKSMREEEKRAREKCRELLDFMGLDEKRDQLANSLAYGEQRKLEIARAMASEPELLLLDEPAAGMNLTEKDDLATTIRKINERGISILLVEHHMKLVMEVCEDICVLNYGKKLAQGAPAEIQNNEEVIKAYLGGEISV